MTRFNRLAIAQAGLLAGLLLAMFLLWSFDQSARLSARMERELTQLSDTYVAAGAEQVGALDDALRLLRHAEERDGVAGLAAAFDAWRVLRPELVEAAAFDGLGRRLGAGGDSALGQPWFVGPRRRGGDALYLDVVRRAPDGRWLLTLSRPRWSASGRFDGVIVLRVRAEALSERLARLPPPAGVSVRWRHLDGTLMAQLPAAPQRIGAQLARPDPLAAQTGRALHVDMHDESPWRVGPVAVGELPLFVDVAARRGPVDTLFMRQTLTVGAIGLITLAVAGVFLLALARQHRSLLRASTALEESYREIHLLNEKLRERAVRDPLTGLYNRVYLEEMLPKELARARRQGEPVTVVMIDFDHFKRINDNYGHAAGDAALRALGQLLAGWVRAGDIVGRYGGEEFIVVLPGLSQEVAAVRVESWRSELAATPVALPGLDDALSVTASFGIAAFPDHGDSGRAVIEKADIALYRAKRQGRNQVVRYGQVADEHA
ncbi:diguanylate cyclase (GGDEF)-like protein [Crenobacter luteus]|uniref:sensor domain-containing diguanylate cyclase n=1 Tax=Crenobacter luteus TaxID=1452487 RepID=UPI0010D9A404|nr:sensor domain-containing diguanylate cyclase [Crenobacter luteus]TCP11212.1 diguanylate cyclase (GGDEF)-like protein [Crenobacter luteus]